MRIGDIVTYVYDTETYQVLIIHRMCNRMYWMLPLVVPKHITYNTHIFYRYLLDAKGITIIRVMRGKKRIA